MPTTDAYGIALADIHRCAECGHMQVVPMPERAELDRAYAIAASDDYVLEEGGQRETARRILARIARHREPGSLLDLGCWVGWFASEAERMGWRVRGVEPSEYGSGFAREQLGLDVLTAGLFTADLGDGRWDVVTMLDVIEHLPDPGQALERVGELVAGDGLLVLSLPDGGSRLARLLGRRWWSVIPTHVHYFTRDSLALLLRRHGWHPLELSTAPKVFTVGYYADRLAGYSDVLGAAAVAGARALRLHRRPVAPDFRDRMLVIARRAPDSLAV